MRIRMEESCLVEIDIAGQNKVAKNTLNALLNEVQATSCQDFSCQGDKPLTNEAYALLFFNGQCLRERL